MWYIEMFIGVNQNYWAINNGALVNHDFNHSTTGYRNLCSKRIKLLIVFLFELIDFSRVPLSSTQTPSIQHIGSTQGPHLFSTRNTSVPHQTPLSSTPKPLSSTHLNYSNHQPWYQALFSSHNLERTQIVFLSSFIPCFTTIKTCRFGYIRNKVSWALFLLISRAWRGLNLTAKFRPVLRISNRVLIGWFNFDMQN